MNKKLSIALGIALAGMSSMAAADTAGDMGLEFSANVAMTSDYVFRGISQNEEDPAIQGGFDVAHTSGVYAGIWGSNVDGDDFFDGASIEIDTYIGWAGEVGPVGVDVGFLHYDYPGANPGNNFDTDEWHIGVSGDVGPVTLGLTYYYSDEFFSATEEGEYWDLSAEMPVGPVTVAAHYGDTEQTGFDYEDWSLGVSTELGGFGFDLTYYDTDGSDLASIQSLADDRVVFTVSKSL